ncbi:MAG: hypothetical protein IT180_12740, partial [Acidobacteria bacterium]|nr:hypothetical protein [Acidobacteriota bacterium]
MRSLLRGILIFFVLLAVAALAGGVYLRSELRASLPQLDGTRTLPGLSAPVRVAR